MTRNMGIVLLLALVPFAVAAETPPEAIKNLEMQGDIPLLDRSDDLAGPDENHNSIRDDIDTYIAKQNYAEPQRKASEQLARSFQQAVIAGGDDTLAQDNAQPIATRMSRAINCAYDTQPETAARNVETYKSLTTNTKQRLKAYLHYSKALDGTASGQPHGDTCDKER